MKLSGYFTIIVTKYFDFGAARHSRKGGKLIWVTSGKRKVDFCEAVMHNVLRSIYSF